MRRTRTWRLAGGFCRARRCADSVMLGVARVAGPATDVQGSRGVCSTDCSRVRAREERRWRSCSASPVIAFPLSLSALCKSQPRAYESVPEPSPSFMTAAGGSRRIPKTRPKAMHDQARFLASARKRADGMNTIRRGHGRTRVRLTPSCLHRACTPSPSSSSITSTSRSY